MKKSVLLSVFLFLGIVAVAQTIIQQGVAYRYNGKLQRTPLGNVTITYDADKRSTVSDEQDGTFSLTLRERKMGDRIGLVTVKKREMMVFNQHAVDEWSVRKEPLKLILCNADEFEKQKENLINIGRSQAKKKYERQRVELEAKLNASEIQRTEYETALDKAYEELERLHKNIGEYADLFARIDESEIDTLAQKAVELFNQGEIDRAIRLFEQGNYMEKLDKALQTSQYADHLMVVAMQAKEKATQDSIKAIESLKAQIEAYKVNNEWEKAGELLKGLADRMNTVEAYWDYASFCYTQNNLKDAIVYYHRALDLLEEQKNKSNNDYLWNISSLQNNLASAYYINRNNPEAESSYENALSIRRNLVSYNFDTYGYGLAQTLSNLATLFSHTHRIAESEPMFKESLDIYRKLLQSQSASYIEDIVAAQNNLANLYIHSNRFSEADSILNEALKLLRCNSDSAHEIYRVYSASVLHNLAYLNMMTTKFSEAESNFKESLEIMRKLTEKNPHAHLPTIALTLNTLGTLHAILGQFSDANLELKEALCIYEQLVVDNPFAFKSHLAETYSNISCTHIYMKKYSTAEQLAREGIKVDNGVNAAYENLAAALLFQGKNDEAEKIYRQYKDELKESFLDDFEQFKAAGVIPKEREEDVEKIKRMLKE